MKTKFILFIMLMSIHPIYGQNIKTKMIPGGENDRNNFTSSITDKYKVDAISQSEKKGFEVVKVEQKLNNLEVIRLNKESGLPDTIFHKIRYKEYVQLSRSGIGLTAVNIPFKTRPALDTIPTTVETDLKNFGVFVGYTRHLDRYFFSGRKSVHSFTYGLFISPIGISLSPENTRGKVTKSTQLGISGGLGFSYSYNKVTLMAIPMAWDFGIGNQAQNWIYNSKYWFGFGLGIETGFFFSE